MKKNRIANTLNLRDTQRYAENRAAELKSLAQRGDPWVFLCASSFIDYLAKLSSGSAAASGKEYKQFLKNWFFKACPQYASFKYASGKQDLAEQMYHVLRCGIVHSFSLFPDPMAKAKYGGRRRSIVLAHRQAGLTHLQRITNKKPRLDAVVFVAEDFVEDIAKVVDFIFTTARKKTASSQVLRLNICKWMKQYPPIGALII